MAEIESHSRRITRLAAELGGAPALTFGDEEVSFADFDRRTNQMARHLQELGAGVGDFVTIAEPNSVEFFVATAACWKIGAVPQPVSSRLPTMELDAIIELADSKVVVGVDHASRTSVPLGFRPGDDVSDEPLPDAISPSWKAPRRDASRSRWRWSRATPGSCGCVCASSIRATRSGSR